MNTQEIVYHAAEGVIVSSKVDAEGSSQLILGPAQVFRPARKQREWDSLSVMHVVRHVSSTAMFKQALDLFACNLIGQAAPSNLGSRIGSKVAMEAISQCFGSCQRGADFKETRAVPNLSTIPLYK